MISANGGLPAHRYTPQVTPRWPRGSEPASGCGLPLVWVCVWFVCAVVGLSPVLAEVPECEFPPLLAGFRCRLWWVVLATPG